ncbi:unnamed protein product [Paramecium pentaurelia]|uniref:Uncharacterized protein n=1 Tax=Paramecium pentaurelia TaxID=43138 RepID=A0A8S1Y3F3_9CILI|nr:unnamed protein product [Paramecium pentaurelia]
MHFPLTLEYPLMLYSEISENQGQWIETEQLVIRIPKSWDLDGNVNDYKIFGMGMGAEEYRESEISSVQYIVADHATDLHYCAKFAYFAKKPFLLQIPQFNVKSYEYIFFKKKDSQDNLLLDIIGLSKRESDLDRKISFLLQQLLYESRYSEIGIKKQVEDALDNIYYKSLKKMIQLIGKKHHIEYESMYELTRKVVRCKDLRLNPQDIVSIVYKTFISASLFPFYCEINTMNDSYIKLKLLSLFTNSEILPWSPKFHASLALGNYHYSFTPNDLFNLRTLNTRTFYKDYQYIRLRILDFFPLDSWIEDVSNFFIQNLETMLNYIQTKMPQQQNQSSLRKQSYDSKSNSSSSILDLKEPLMREEQKETELIQDSCNNSQQSFNVLTNCSELFKILLKNSIRKIENVREVFGIVIHTPFIVQVKNRIANEFYENYSSEINRNGILSQFCSIITETELRSYSTCANNCQTPVAAFIYLLCDTFRPFSEMLCEKTHFLKSLQQCGFNIRNIKHNQFASKSSFIDTDNKLLTQYLATYCKFASINEFQLLGELFIQPAILECSLDYFGFYSDELSARFLTCIQKIDFDPEQFQQIERMYRPYRFSNSYLFNDTEAKEFVEAFDNCSRSTIYQHENQKEENLVEYLQKFQNNNTKQYTKSRFNLHYLLQFFQNQLIKLKQEGLKQVKTKHRIQDYLDTVYYFYFNSIRLQIVQKQRQNTLSLIGFVIAKDLNQLHSTKPQNVELQI